MVRLSVRVATLVFALTLLTALGMNLFLVKEIRDGLFSSGRENARSEVSPLGVVGVLLPEGSDNFLLRLKESLNTAASQENIVLQFFLYNLTDGSFDKTWFPIASDIQLDGLVVFLGPGASAKKLGEEARDKMLPLVLLGVDRPDDYSFGYLGSSLFQQGFMAGKEALKLRPRGLRPGVLLPWNEEGLWDNDPFFSGVRAALDTSSSRRLIGIRRTFPGLFSGEDAALEAMSRHPEINTLICMDGPDTEGAVQVLIDSNLLGNVEVVGADDSQAIERFLEKELLSVTIVRNADAIANSAISELISQMEGKSPSPPREIDFRVQTGRRNSP